MTSPLRGGGPAGGGGSWAGPEQSQEGAGRSCFPEYPGFHLVLCIALRRRCIGGPESCGGPWQGTFGGEGKFSLVIGHRCWARRGGVGG